MSYKLLLVLGWVLIAAAHSVPSQAEQWRVISTTYAGQFYPGWSFEDGQYAASDMAYNMSTSLDLPSSTSGNMTTLTFANWSAQYPLMTPPSVDLATSTINLSSLVQVNWVTDLFHTSYPAVIYSYYYYGSTTSYNIGALTPTPFTANGDGTYTATWITPVPFNNSTAGGQTVSITFAPASMVNLVDPGITDSGDVVKNGNGFSVGTTATGTRNVQRTPHVFDNIYLGNAPGIDGNLVISCVPTSQTVGSLTSTQEMVIGNYGIGTVSL